MLYILQVVKRRVASLKLVLFFATTKTYIFDYCVWLRQQHIIFKMGLLLDRLKQIELSPASNTENETAQDDFNFDSHANSSPRTTTFKTSVQFPDLETIPPELSLQILKYLNATDLCLAACVWSSLANDDVLWQSLCRSTWGYATCYKTSSSGVTVVSYRKIFMQLDEATLTFNADWKKVQLTSVFF